LSLQTKILNAIKLPLPCMSVLYYHYTHVVWNSHGGTVVVCWTVNSTVHVCSTQMDHTECTSCIQLPNTSYRTRFLQVITMVTPTTTYILQQFTAMAQTETSLQEKSPNVSAEIVTGWSVYHPKW